MDSLTLKIDKAIQEADIIHHESIPDYVRDNPNLMLVLEGAELLFHGIRDIHSTKSPDKIASRYVKNKKRLEKITPKR